MKRHPANKPAKVAFIIMAIPAIVAAIYLQTFDLRTHPDVRTALIVWCVVVFIGLLLWLKAKGIKLKS